MLPISALFDLRIEFLIYLLRVETQRIDIASKCFD
jgi:hypothetical protein